MKKLLPMLAFLLPSIGWCAFQPVNGSTIVIVAPNSNTLAIPISGTITSITNPVTITPGANAVPIVSTNTLNVSQQGTVTVGPSANSLVISATSTIPISGNIGTVTTITNPVTVLPGASSIVISATSTIPVSGSLSASMVNITTATYGTTLPTSGSAIGFISSVGGIQAAAVNTSSHVLVSIPASTMAVRQDGSIWTIANSTIGVTQVGIQTIANSTIAVVSLGNFGIANSTIAVVFQTPQSIMNSTIAVVGLGNFSIANSSISVVNLMLVSSSTVLPTAAADATQAKAMIDAYGRTVTISGVPTAIQSSTAPVPFSNTTAVVLVSSPSATTFTHMCGCTVGNTSATNTFVTFFMRGDVTSSGSKRVMAPANNFPTGYAMDCSTPFLNTRGGEQVAVQANASVSSLYVDCVYYQSTVP